MVNIECHTDCVYLDANVEYQQKRVGDQFDQGRRVLYRELLEKWGDRAAEVFYFLEVVTFKHFHSRRDGQDGEVITAIQALRRSFSPIQIPEGMAPAFTETLQKEYTAFVEGEKIDTDMAGEVLDRGLIFITEFSGPGLRSTRFLDGLTGFLKSHHPDVAEQLTKLSETHDRIILPPGAKREDSPIIS